MVEDHEFKELQVRLSEAETEIGELKRLVKHQGEQLGVHAGNVETHGDHVARLAAAQVDADKRLQAALDDKLGKPAPTQVPQKTDFSRMPEDDHVRAMQAAAQGQRGGAFS